MRDKYYFEKFNLKNNINLEDVLWMPENMVCLLVGRYADGYVYRIMKSVTMRGEIFFECRILIHSCDNDVFYLTPEFDNVKIHLIDPEHGTLYVTGFEFCDKNKRKLYKCRTEIFTNEDVQDMSLVTDCIEKQYMNKFKNYEDIKIL